MAPPRVGEVVRLGLLDGNPTATSPYIYFAPSGSASSRSSVLPLAILVEPCAAWRGTATHAAHLVTTALRVTAHMQASNLPARLHALFDNLNSAERQRALECGAHRSAAQAAGFGMSCLVLAGSDLYIAQLPPGQLLIRQGTHIYATPPTSDTADAVAGFDAHDPAPLGRDAQTTPRLLHTRVAAGDVIMLANSTMLRGAPRAVRELSLASLDALVTEIGTAADRARLRNGVVGIMRLA